MACTAAEAERADGAIPCSQNDVLVSFQIVYLCNFPFQQGAGGGGGHIAPPPVPAVQTFEAFVAGTAPHLVGGSVVPWSQKHELSSRPARVKFRWWQAQAQLARDAAASPRSMTPPRQRFATTPPQLSSRTQPKSSATVHGTNDVLVVAAAGRGEAEVGGGADGKVELFAACSGVAVMKPHHPAAPDCFGTARIVSHRPMPLVLVYQRGSGRNGFGGGPLVMLCQGPVGPSASAKKIDWPGPATRSLSDQSTSHFPVLGFCQTHLPSNSSIWDQRATHSQILREWVLSCAHPEPSS